MDNMILQLATMPAVAIGLDQYRKELIKVGKYTHPSTKAVFEITPSTLKHFVKEFSRYTANGNKVPIPAGHDRDNKPELNQGWVTDLFIEGNSLFGMLALINSELALTTDVSLCIEAEVIDGKKNKYHSVITHVALTTHPVVAGLDGFKKLSLSIGEDNMKFLERIATALGLSNATEEDVLKAIEEKKKKKKKEKAELSVKIDPLVGLVSDNRTMKLSGLVKAGLITPAVKDLIVAKYVEPEALALSMKTGEDNGFDLLYDILVLNRPVKLDEVTGVQSLELANRQVAQPNGLVDDMNKLREEQGIKD